MLGIVIVVVTVIFRTRAEFPILLGGLCILLILIGIDYWQWIHRER